MTQTSLLKRGGSNFERGPKVELPGAVVEKIVAAIPFPYVFTARLLCREWYSKFESVVTPTSTKWPKYCPVFFTNKGLLGYDRVADSWQTFCEPLQFKYGSPAAFGGVLLCLLEHAEHGEKSVATVINLLTGKQRTVLLPRNRGKFPFSPIIVPIGLDHYKIVIWGFVETQFYSYEYDSRSRTWACKSSSNVNFRGCSSFKLHSNGKYFCTSSGPHNDNREIRLIRFDLEVGILTETPPIRCELDHFAQSAVVFCGPRIIVVVIEGDHQNDVCVARVLQLDVKSFNLTELSRSCLDSLMRNYQGGHLMKLVWDNDCIYFCGAPVLTSYNVHSNTWSSHGPLPATYFKFLSICCRAFEPGLNPFVTP